jgi:hypothetical protein
MLTACILDKKSSIKSINCKSKELIKEKNCKNEYDDNVLRKLALLWVQDVISETKKASQ